MSVAPQQVVKVAAPAPAPVRAIVPPVAAPTISKPQVSWTLPVRRNVSPHPGEKYVQVAAFGPRRSIRIFDNSRAKGLHPLVAPGPADGIHRILIGPYTNQRRWSRPAAHFGRCKDQLRCDGFHLPARCNQWMQAFALELSKIRIERLWTNAATCTYFSPGCGLTLRRTGRVQDTCGLLMVGAATGGTIALTGAGAGAATFTTCCGALTFFATKQCVFRRIG